METVWKFPLKMTGEIQEVEMPDGAVVLHFNSQRGEPIIWAQLDDQDKGREVRSFLLVGTGHRAPDAGTYIGTALFRNGEFVFHLYELL